MDFDFDNYFPEISKDKMESFNDSAVKVEFTDYGLCINYSGYSLKNINFTIESGYLIIYLIVKSKYHKIKCHRAFYIGRNLTLDDITVNQKDETVEINYPKNLNKRRTRTYK